MAASSSSAIATYRLVLPSCSTPSNRGRVGACSPDAPGRSIIHFPSSSCCLAKRWRRSRSNLIAAIRRSGAATAVASLAGRNAKKRETLVPDPDYRIPVVLLGFAGFLTYQDNLLAAAPIGLLGLLLLFQTTRVRFVFDEEALEVKVGDALQESGENVFVGGKNRWKYSSFVNWELWWPNFPILVYFKETQTKPEGQVHFFPVIFNGKQLYDVMVERAGPSTASGPKET